MLGPFDIADLVANQRVGGARIGHPQQRLGKAHQRDAFFCVEPVLVEEGVDAADVALARILDQRDRPFVNRGMLPRIDLRLAETFRDALRLFLPEGASNRGSIERLGIGERCVIGGRVLCEHIHISLARWTRRTR